MKAINTKYKGYNFRSRVEARWAVFFDSLGIKWEYEKEGYELDDGTWYLPDFYIEDFGWIEIKGKSATDEEKEKARLLSKCGEGVAIIIGTPHLNTHSCYFDGSEEGCSVFWCSYSVRKWGGTPFFSGADVGVEESNLIDANDYLALEKAKSMRFEFEK